MVGKCVQTLLREKVDFVRKSKPSLKSLVCTFLATMLVVSTMLPAGLSHKAQAQISEQVVISQVYGGGGNSGAPYKNDFIELYNPTDQDISLEGGSVQYASGRGTTWTPTNLAGTIKAHSFYLITEAGGANGVELPTADASGGISWLRRPLRRSEST